MNYNLQYIIQYIYIYKLLNPNYCFQLHAPWRIALLPLAHPTPSNSFQGAPGQLCHPVAPAHATLATLATPPPSAEAAWRPWAPSRASA